MTITKYLSELAIETAYKKISKKAIDDTKKLILDTIGVALAAAGQPGVADVVEQMKYWGGRPEARIIYYGDSLPLPNAAFVNATMIHALDFDDIHLSSVQHIMASVFGASLAVSDSRKTTGAELIAAIILGVEVAARIGNFGRKCKGKSPGASWFLPSSVEGGFGVVAAVSRLLGLSVSQTTNAMGIYYAQASGNRQALLDMSLTKRLQPAFAAQSAVQSVCLAQRGITGPLNVFEGDSGLFHIYYDGKTPDVKDFLGNDDYWQIEGDAIKFFPSCGGCHPTALAALKIFSMKDFSSKNIERVEILLKKSDEELVGKKFHLGSTPQVGVQFSATYWVAKALIQGKIVIDDIKENTILTDLETLDLAKNIKILPQNGEMSYKVTVYMKNGTELSSIESRKNFFIPEEIPIEKIIEKFNHCLAFANLKFPRTNQLIDTVLNFDKLDIINILDQTTFCKKS